MLVSCDEKTIADGAALLRLRAPYALKEERTPEGYAVIRGKVEDRFHFVNRVSVTVEPDKKTVRAFSCACPRFTAKRVFCEHCAALLLQHSPEEPLTPQSAGFGAPSEPSELPQRISRAPAEDPGAGPAVEVPAEALPDPDGSAETDLPPEEPPAETPEPQPTGEAEEETPEAADETAEPEAESAEPEAEEETPAFAPPGIEVLFGSTLADNAPVFWTPNDTERLFHTNTGIIGTMGTGKTQFTKSLVTQLVREGGRNYGGSRPNILIFDYKGDYNETKADFIAATGARVLKPYRLPYNPFALTRGVTFRPLLPIHTANAFKDTVSKIFPLGPKQQQLLLECIVEAYVRCGVQVEEESTWSRRAPTFRQVWEVFSERTEKKPADSLSAAMNKLQNFHIFEDRALSLTSIGAALQGVAVLDLSGYDPDIQNLVVAITLDQYYTYMQTLGSSKTDGRHRQLRQLILVDEADNFMQGNFPSLRKLMKEGREFGVGTVLSTQSLTHFTEGGDDYSKYILTWVVHAMGDLKQRDVEYIFKLPPKCGLTEQIFTAVKGLEKHQSVVKIASDLPVVLRDKAFWELMKAPEEPLAGMPEKKEEEQIQKRNEAVVE